MDLVGKRWLVSELSREDADRTVLEYDLTPSGIAQARRRVGVFETSEAARRACRAINSYDEMLAALKLAESFVAGFEDDQNVASMLAAMRAALAKAEGR